MIKLEKIAPHVLIDIAALRRQGWKWFAAVIGLQLVFMLCILSWQQF